ncbi:MAG TPA: hypothetical protein VKB14_18105 [Actinomycetales bacterium]|nr:hypothetical protein [Actinomycetales bacterium]
MLWGLLAGTSQADATGRWGLAILAALVLGAVVVERVLYRTSPRAALRLLGLGRSGGRALALAGAVSVIVLGYLIPTSAVTTFPLLLIAVSLLVPLLCLAVPRRFLVPAVVRTA